MRPSTLFATAILILGVASANAVTLREVIRACGDDGKKLCPKVGYGRPMQNCLIDHEAALAPVCRSVTDRLKKGERVTLF